MTQTERPPGSLPAAFLSSGRCRWRSGAGDACPDDGGQRDQRQEDGDCLVHGTIADLNVHREIGADGDWQRQATRWLRNERTHIMPASWLLAERLAARTLGLGMTDAGIRLLVAGNPAMADVIGQGVRIVIDNGQALDACRHRAAKARRAVRCTIGVAAR